MDVKFVFPRFKLFKKVTLRKIQNGRRSYSTFDPRFLLNISGTFQVRGLKMLPQMQLDGMHLLPSIHFLLPCTVWA